jgi:hypothetical protein
MAIGAEVQAVKTSIIVKTTSGEERFDGTQYQAQVMNGLLFITDETTQPTDPYAQRWLQTAAAVYAPGAWLSYRVQEETS